MEILPRRIWELWTLPDVCPGHTAGQGCFCDSVHPLRVILPTFSLAVWGPRLYCSLPVSTEVRREPQDHRPHGWGSRDGKPVRWGLCWVCSVARCQKGEARKMPSSLTPCCVLCPRKALIGERECVSRLSFTLKVSPWVEEAGSSPGFFHFLVLLNCRMGPR